MEREMNEKLFELDNAQDNEKVVTAYAGKIAKVLVDKKMPKEKKSVIGRLKEN